MRALSPLATRSAGAVLLAAALALSGCGGEPEAAPAPQETSTSAPAPDLPEEGTAVPELLSGVRCASGDGGWNVAGTVTNPTDAEATYQVTVQVGPAGTAGPAATKRLVGVEPDARVTFELEDVVPADPAGPCHVQLLVLPEAG